MLNTVYVVGLGSISNAGTINGRSARTKQWQPISAGTTLGLPMFRPEEFITQKRDINAMGAGQKMLVCAAGLALQDAGMQGADLTDCDIYIASKIGERNEEVDAAILAARNDHDFDMNVHLARLRPTHFLAELPNLYAANIAMIFGAKGESLTFVGEAAASVHSLIQAIEKIESGNARNIIVGGVFNGDQRLHDEFRQTMKAPLFFGSAAGCVVLSSVAENAIGEVKRIPQFKLEDLSKLLEELNITSLCVSSLANEDGSISWADIVEGRPVQELQNYVGDVFEASVPLLVGLSLSHLNDAIAPRIMVVVEVGKSYFEAFVITVI